MKPHETSVHWFRRDLRLADNPGLVRAARAGRVLPVFIDDPEHPQEVALGAASRAWLHQALAALDRSLGGRLNIFRGAPRDVLCALAQRHGATRVRWNALPDSALASRDAGIRAALKARGVAVTAENGFLLWDPGEIRKADGKPYRVFTPFFRAGCRAAPPPRKPLPAPGFETVRDAEALPLAALGLWPRQDWSKGVLVYWQPDEAAAQARLQRFVADRLARYPDARDHPGTDGTSRLSPHLHFGIISPNQIWHAAHGPGTDKLRAELGWRDFSWHLLVHNPKLADAPLRPQFARMPWRDDPAAFRAWAQGRTGIPLVDAGMRELWQTGWMAGQVRMVVASFLVKNLLIDWRRGTAWFRDTLVDADPASNAASWQWLAGCGADAVPFFRIFNPSLQGQKFDRDGTYTRRFLPELAGLPDRWLPRPWAAPAEVLAEAGLRLGHDYPRPIVDLAASRARALEVFASLGDGPQAPTRAWGGAMIQKSAENVERMRAVSRCSIGAIKGPDFHD